MSEFSFFQVLSGFPAPVASLQFGGGIVQDPRVNLGGIWECFYFWDLLKGIFFIYSFTFVFC